MYKKLDCSCTEPLNPIYKSVIDILNSLYLVFPHTNALACLYKLSLKQRGFFHGYSVTVATVITFQAAGGLIVAIVVKYADNVMKNFATSFSIILSSLASAYFFHDIQINAYFLGGGVIVLTSVYVNHGLCLGGYSSVMLLPYHIEWCSRNPYSSSIIIGSNSSIV